MSSPWQSASLHVAGASVIDPETDLGRQERCSTGGRRAGTSHTAAAAAPDIAVDTLFRQAGVLRMDTLGELVDAAWLLTEQPLPAGDRFATAGNAGGLNVLAADAAEAAGLHVVELSATLQQEFADLAPHLASVTNPVDLGADVPPATIAGEFGFSVPQVKPTRWWSRWSRRAQ
jgi:acyl-CoA synthetase (NDP forming)